VRRATLDSPLRPASGQKSVDQTGSKRVATADAIEYLEILANRRLLKFT
jgi:hypothetical protein